MDESLRTVNLGYAVASEEQRNRVLRNTYWLLALSMVPTVLGAWIGVSTGIMATMGAGMSAIVFLAGAFGFIFAIEKTKNSAAGVPVLLAFTFFMGLMLSRLIGHVLGFSNGGAGLIMIGVRRHRRRDLPRHGGALVGHQARPVVDGQVPVWSAPSCCWSRASLNIFLQSSALFITIAVSSSASSPPSSLYDLKRVKDGLETNYISATLSIYLDLYNIFQALLSILGFAGSRD